MFAMPCVMPGVVTSLPSGGSKGILIVQIGKLALCSYTLQVLSTRTAATAWPEADCYMQSADGLAGKLTKQDIS